MTSIADTSLLAYVLDDEPAIRIIVSRVLNANGYSAHQFSECATFLQSVATEPPALIVLDLALGQSDAVDVMRRLEALSYRGKILLISGRDELTLREIQQIGISRGLAMLPPLGKPFRSADLMKAVAAEADMPAAAPAPNPPSITIDVAEALSRGWLELWYQPKIDLKVLSVCGAEALLRARHPEHGILAPISFLPPAGDPRHQPLSRFVLERALSDWCEFLKQGVATRLAVNMPISIVGSPDFVDFVRRNLPSDPRFPGLIIEITEDEAIHQPELIKEVATQLRLYNVSLSIDDFGAAYSNLSRLLDLSCAELKLDRVFVSGCGTDHLKRALCQTVIDLAHKFDASVCAEGVENSQDITALLDLGCDVAQGYFYQRPIAPDDFIAYVKDPTRQPGKRILEFPRPRINRARS